MKRSTRDSSTTATSKTLKYINTTRRREEILEKTQQRLTNHFSTNPLTDATSCKICIQTQQNSTFDDSQCNSSDINTVRTQDKHENDGIKPATLLICQRGSCPHALVQHHQNENSNEERKWTRITRRSNTMKCETGQDREKGASFVWSSPQRKEAPVR